MPITAYQKHCIQEIHLHIVLNFMVVKNHCAFTTVAADIAQLFDTKDNHLSAINTWTHQYINHMGYETVN